MLKTSLERSRAFLGSEVLNLWFYVQYKPTELKTSTRNCLSPVVGSLQGEQNGGLKRLNNALFWLLMVGFCFERFGFEVRKLGHLDFVRDFLSI